MAGRGEAPVLVVGGGIVGLVAAWRLREAGRPVLLLERGRTIESASAGNAGLIAPGHLPLPRPGQLRRAARWLLDPLSPLHVTPTLRPALWRWLLAFLRAGTWARVERSMGVLDDLERRSLALWERLAGELDLRDELRPLGVLHVYRGAAGREHCLQDARVAARHGWRVEPLAGAALRELEPALAGDVLGGVLYPQSLFLDPARVVAGLAALLRERGVDLREGTRAVRLLAAGGRPLGRGGRPAAVLAEGGGGERAVLPVAGVVLAAGAWTTPLAATLGLRLPMEGGKGYHLDLALPTPCAGPDGEAPGTIAGPPLPRRACILAETSVAVTPLPDRLRLAGTLELSGLDLRLRPRRLEQLRRGTVPYLPAVAALPERSRWCGLRPCTADGLPVLGAVPGIDGLVVATGGAKLGLALGPALGALAADLLVDRAGERPPAAVRAALAPDRFGRRGGRRGL